MTSGTPTPDGIRFDPEPPRTKIYISVYKHRGAGSARHKSCWCSAVGPDIEYSIFCASDDGEWKDKKGHYWGLLNGGQTILGTEKQRLCKFPCPQNDHDPWHGFPISIAKGDPHQIRKEGRWPPDEVVEFWLENKIITRRTARLIEKGKI